MRKNALVTLAICGMLSLGLVGCGGDGPLPSEKSSDSGVATATSSSSGQLVKVTSRGNSSLTPDTCNFEIKFQKTADTSGIVKTDLEDSVKKISTWFTDDGAENVDVSNIEITENSTEPKFTGTVILTVDKCLIEKGFVDARKAFDLNAVEAKLSNYTASDPDAAYKEALANASEGISDKAHSLYESVLGDAALKGGASLVEIEIPPADSVSGTSDFTYTLNAENINELDADDVKPASVPVNVDVVFTYQVH